MLYLRELSYHPTATPAPILKSINLELAPQQMGLVIGPSGSGKSTLLEVLAGLSENTSGRVLWRDQELTPEHLQQLAGLVFQFPERYFCGGTILEELRLGHPELGSQRVQEALTEVGLAHLSLGTSPHSLSGGQQRRLALAVQLIRQPHLLLLDEPTAGLDWSMRRQLVSLLAKLKNHLSLFVVTHDAGDLLAIADRCWTLNHGELIAVDPVKLRTENSKSRSAEEQGGTITVK
ncbi:energy-coupling factor ABC transporter ATP-binding protein [Phormidium sp. LEGE 05292]|uniref:ABC transporter ATP-binding protein n=1 Tax=[Phormidium] sp. LEGE 05292 TaxID=767427 RepID=UPI0018804E4B|nr:energy-coupling factor ABC transporter ATP-binding protein [Phormidium sp. LEGE 05292]MBE9225701.1 energy-coupling factor ABC transporter ATP-binding protein [Phormidium sp. LEGE 05292]